MELHIEYMSPHDLKPYAGNAKKHTAEDITAIKESIKDVGFLDPIGVWGPENIIVEGHGRQLAAIELGIESVPVIRLDHLTPEIAEDDYEEVGIEPRAKLGDIYQLGKHRLMCGDSTDPEAWEKLMAGEKADMVFTDPPYGVAIGDKNAALDEVQKAGRITENIKGDTMSEGELYDTLKRAFINVRENCADDACYFVTSPQGGSLGLMMMMMMRDAGLPVRHVLMWKKNCATFSIGRLDYDYQHEPIFYTWTKSHHNTRGGIPHYCLGS